MSGMVTMIDRPYLKVELRADIADQFEVCPRCEGRPYRYIGISFGMLSVTSGPYAGCSCGNGIRRRAAAAYPPDQVCVAEVPPHA